MDLVQRAHPAKTHSLFTISTTTSTTARRSASGMGLDILMPAVVTVSSRRMFVRKMTREASR